MPLFPHVYHILQEWSIDVFEPGTALTYCGRVILTRKELDHNATGDRDACLGCRMMVAAYQAYTEAA